MGHAVDNVRARPDNKFDPPARSRPMHEVTVLRRELAEAHLHRRDRSNKTTSVSNVRDTQRTRL